MPYLGARGRRGAKLPYEATIYSMDPFELISTPQVDSRQCGHLLCQKNHPSIADSLSDISHISPINLPKSPTSAPPDRTYLRLATGPHRGPKIYIGQKMMVGGVFEIPCDRRIHLGTILSLYTQLSALFTPLPHDSISPPLYT